jgi:succinate dehydrogenase / fumarate reductase cytochrome b subunit
MRLGMYAWVIQRITGLYLVFFLLTHITAIAQANFGITSAAASMFDVLRNPFWAGGTATIIFDFVALAIIAFHGLNGIRIVFLDLGLGVRRHTLAFWFTMIIAVAVTALIIALALPILPGR